MSYHCVYFSSIVDTRVDHSSLQSPLLEAALKLPGAQTNAAGQWLLSSLSALLMNWSARSCRLGFLVGHDMTIHASDLMFDQVPLSNVTVTGRSFLSWKFSLINVLSSSE